jgi:hypothetical protein
MQDLSRDSLDVPLVDETLLAELELTTALIIAASECSNGRLRQDQLDRALGLVRPE